MAESNRVYKRKKITIPFTFSTDDNPPLVSPRQAMALDPEQSDRPTLCSASMKNSCTDGFCFQTGKKLAPGTTIHARMVNFKPMELGNEAVEDCHARVRWCHKQTTVGMENCYDVGVKKIRREKLPIINWKNPDFASLKCF